MTINKTIRIFEEFIETVRLLEYNYIAHVSCILEDSLWTIGLQQNVQKSGMFHKGG